MADIDDEIIVIQSPKEIKVEQESSQRTAGVTRCHGANNPDTESKNEEKPVVVDVYSITTDDFIQIEDDSDEDSDSQANETTSAPPVNSTLPNQDTVKLDSLLARLEALEQFRIQSQRKLEALQNEVAASHRDARSLKRRLADLERGKRCKRCRSSAHHPAGTSISTAVDDTDESSLMETETGSQSSSPDHREVRPLPTTWFYANNAQAMKPEEIVVTPKLEIYSDDSTLSQTPRQEASAVIPTPESSDRQLTEEINVFIDQFKEVMKLRGLIYADITKWSEANCHNLTPGKISFFLNRKLNETKSREMMALLTKFLNSSIAPHRLSESSKLSDNLSFEIDKNINKMTSLGLKEDDFISWTKLSLNVDINKSHVRQFSDKCLDEEESHRMIALFQSFFKEKMNNSLRRRKFSFKRRFSESQLQILNKALEENPYPKKGEVEELAIKLNTTWSRVKNWFMNRRQERRLAKSSKQ